MKRIDEFVVGHASLLKQADESADFHFAMVGHNAAHGAATHDNVATALTSNYKAKTFQRRTTSAPETTGNLGKP